MPTPNGLLNASPPCLIELGPSRWLASLLAAIGVLGAGGLFLTHLTLGAAVALAPVVVAWGLWLARRELSRGTLRVFLCADGHVEVDGMTVVDASIDFQGPITRLGWAGSHRRTRIAAWPDVVGASQRRELRLWAIAHRANASTAAVAP
ncbi:hypothetical protein [Cognatilysobacter lacus]|uniref:Uncharacterized protein n=1 Tax=Cognatilysobacter lacus TaxID=1643323 RepID=A0A5D8Z3W8_9GAMM|nr:hypothetical protein [Lysobacter lacus]TZF89675.1 hypothetical protein FW784_08335 [Lysobacter lacus]